MQYYDVIEWIAHFQLILIDPNILVKVIGPYPHLQMQSRVSYHIWLSSILS